MEKSNLIFLLLPYYWVISNIFLHIYIYILYVSYISELYIREILSIYLTVCLSVYLSSTNTNYWMKSIHQHILQIFIDRHAIFYVYFNVARCFMHYLTFQKCCIDLKGTKISMMGDGKKNERLLLVHSFNACIIMSDLIVQVERIQITSEH